MLNLALAFPVGEYLYLGVTGTYLNLYSDFAPISAMTVTAGAYLKAGTLARASFVGYNLINTYHQDMLPIGMAAGLSFGPDTTFHVNVDWYREYGAEDVHADRWSAGAEVFLFDVASIRGGWLYDAGSKSQWWSAGAGFSVSGFGAELAYRGSFGGTTFRTLAAMIRLGIPGM